MPKCSGAPAVGDMVTLRTGWALPWPEGETWLVVATRGIEVLVLMGHELVCLRREVVNVV